MRRPRLRRRDATPDTSAVDVVDEVDLTDDEAETDGDDVGSVSDGDAPADAGAEDAVASADDDPDLASDADHGAATDEDSGAVDDGDDLPAVAGSVADGDTAEDPGAEGPLVEEPVVDGAGVEEPTADVSELVDPDESVEPHDPQAIAEEPPAAAAPRRRRSAATTVPAAPAAPPSAGSRRARRAEQRRRRRRQRALRTVGIVAGLALLGAGGVAIWDLFDRADQAPVTQPTGDGTQVLPEGVDPQPTILFATVTDEGPATSLALLAWDRLDEDVTLVFIPAATVADIPGRGLLQLGSAHDLGGPALLATSVDNLLGIQTDAIVTMTEQDWATVFTRVGGLEVAVEQRLRATDEDGETSIRFQPGEQDLDGPRVAELLTLIQPAEAELSRLPRQQRVLESFFALLAEDEDAVGALFDDQPPAIPALADQDAARELFVAAAEAIEDGTFTTLTLPVVPRGSGSTASYEIDRDRADAVIRERLGASAPTAVAAEARRLQVLNGNGTPGIGQDVAELLIPLGFRIVLTGNADSFDNEVTQIIVYSSDPEPFEAARTVRDTLGVGDVVLSDTPQSVVDITIVIGRDFLDR